MVAPVIGLTSTSGSLDTAAFLIRHDTPGRAMDHRLRTCCFIATLAAGAFGSSEGKACSVGRADWVKLNLDQIVERSTRVVYGWVESVAVERASGRVTATVRTVRSLKGAAVKRFDLVYRVQSCVESIPPRKHHYIFLDDGCTETGVGCITFIESEHADGDFRSRLAKLTRDQPQPSGAVVDQHDLLR